MGLNFIVFNPINAFKLNYLYLLIEIPPSHYHHPIHLMHHRLIAHHHQSGRLYTISGIPPSVNRTCLDGEIVFGSQNASKYKIPSGVHVLINIYNMPIN